MDLSCFIAGARTPVRTLAGGPTVGHALLHGVALDPSHFGSQQIDEELPEGGPLQVREESTGTQHPQC